MFGRYKPPKKTDEEQQKQKQELRDANITSKEMWAMIRSALLVFMPVAIGVLAIFVLVAWLFVSG